MIKIIAAFIVSLIGTYLLGVLFIGQVNLASVGQMGLSVGFGDRIDTLIHDLANMRFIYLPLVATSSIIAFPVAALLFRRKPKLRLFGYMLAGFTALLAIHLIMKMVLGLSGVAATRTIVGLLAQGFAGAFGGYLFHLLTQPKALST